MFRIKRIESFGDAYDINSGGEVLAFCDYKNIFAEFSFEITAILVRARKK